MKRTESLHLISYNKDISNIQMLLCIPSFTSTPLVVVHMFQLYTFESEDDFDPLTPSNANFLDIQLQ